ncbi:MAG TPA: YhzD family protein [Bacillota bacterium]|nr:YhzD family protein [Bacillota bacterium]
MNTYSLTVFSQNGEKLLDEVFEAKNNEQAKETGNAMLAEEGYSEYTHRCVTSNGKLVLFHR